MADANALLVDAYGRVRESVAAVLEGLTADQAAWRPAPEANSVGWLVWHLTRVLDDHLAELRGVDQVWDTHEYVERFALALPRHDTGYGHTPAEVAAVRAEPELLAAYHRAVHDSVRPYLETVDDYGRIVDTRWDPPVTLGVRLISVLDDMARHLGQAEYVRGLLPR
ncbi:MAG: DUF664 domain-containing protein [Nocardioides sp.]